MKIQLEKEPDNKYDPEAIQVKLKGMGKNCCLVNNLQSVWIEKSFVMVNLYE